MATTQRPPARSRPRRRARSGSLADYRVDTVRPAVLRRRRKVVSRITLGVLISLAALTGSLAGLMLVYSTNLPQISDLEHYNPSTSTDLYDRHGQLVGRIALEQRDVVTFNDFAPLLREGVISVEDKSFYSHWGVNVFRIVGAAIHDMRTHTRGQGASTLTMQLARNLFLNDDRTFSRKIQEAYLAIQIERTFTKQQIFTLYANQIYLGSGMYGFEAASRYYFSKHASDLTVTEASLLAGLPKGPVAFSPILHPDKAVRRRNLVLTEMEGDRMISRSQAEAARAAPLGLHLAQPAGSVAPWFQDEVRQELDSRFGSEQVHEDGLRIQMTLDLNLQRTANRSVLDGLAAYERRRGWAGRLENVIAAGGDMETYKHPDWAVGYTPGDYVHALVTRVLPSEIDAHIGGEQIILLPTDWQWTGQRYADSFIKPGDIIYVQLSSTTAAGIRRATLQQDSGAQGSLLAIDNATGGILAMVGGRDYFLSQFNRATQAARQVGSSFKPYVYAAAIEDGVKPTDMVLDTPVRFGSYTPHDYENNFLGPITVAKAFADSRNIPALRLAARVGIHNVIDTAHRFGVTSEIPPYLPIALGAVGITLEQQVASYAVFPNDGFRVAPRLIRSVQSADGITLWQDPSAVKQVINDKTARTMMTLLEGVVQQGTGAAAAELNHPLGGKTGTTSDFTNAWFIGFSPSVTCGVWVGYDNNKTLGNDETGARAALPIWIDFMRTAIANHPDEYFLGEHSVTEAQQRPNTVKPQPGLDSAGLRGRRTHSRGARSSAILRQGQRATSSITVRQSR